MGLDLNAGVGSLWVLQTLLRPGGSPSLPLRWSEFDWARVVSPEFSRAWGGVSHRCWERTRVHGFLALADALAALKEACVSLEGQHSTRKVRVARVDYNIRVTSVADISVSISAVDRTVDRIEAVIHPEGRCVECGGGRPHWRHISVPGAVGFYHSFKPAQGDVMATTKTLAEARLRILTAIDAVPDGSWNIEFDCGLVERADTSLAATSGSWWYVRWQQEAGSNSQRDTVREREQAKLKLLAT